MLNSSLRTGNLLYALGTVVMNDGRPEEGFDYQFRAFIQFRNVSGESGLDAARTRYKLAIHHLRHFDFPAAE